ncbi:hypothetical protein WG66_003043 [Moniliophthora roreri]|nr:hypothetical protein WG66_003043 [Moniliophthora roreri]
MIQKSLVSPSVCGGDNSNKTGALQKKLNHPPCALSLGIRMLSSSKNSTGLGHADPDQVVSVPLAGWPPSATAVSARSHFGGLALGQDCHSPSRPNNTSSSHSGGILAKEREVFSGWQYATLPSTLVLQQRLLSSDIHFLSNERRPESHSQHGKSAVTSPDAELEEQRHTYLTNTRIVNRDAIKNGRRSIMIPEWQAES